MPPDSNSPSRATAYTVKQVARLSGVSIRTLHFYDEVGLLKPAYQNTNGYRFYEETQLLLLQQILFYRELGFELRQIRDILKRPDFEKVTALMAHREVLEETLARTRTLLQTIHKTAAHLKGGKQMTDEEMFVGFTVAAGKDRFDENFSLPIDCKLSGRDTGNALSVFEMNGRASPLHLHHEEDEWVYVVDGSLEFEVGDRRFQVVAGESLFLPRKVAHAWASATGQPVRTIHVYQPAGRIEEFFRRIGRFEDSPIQEVPSFDEARRFFEEHGMKLLGPPPAGWTMEGAMMSPPASPDLPGPESGREL